MSRRGVLGRKLGINAAAVSLLLSAIVQVNAAPIVLSDGNSSLTIDPSSILGVSNWTVEGQNQVDQQYFGYRIGGVGPVLSVDTLLVQSVNQLNSSQLDTTYANGLFEIRINYSLVGGSGGSGESSLAIQVAINNLTLAPLPIEFFQYADFAPGGSTSYTGQLGTGSGGFNEAFVTDGTTSIETAATGATHGEVSLNTTLQTKLLAGLPLNDSLLAVGPANVSWALEWERLLAAGGGTTLSIVQFVSGVPVINVPDSGNAALLFGFACTMLFACGLAVNRLQRRPALARI